MQKLENMANTTEDVPQHIFLRGAQPVNSSYCPPHILDLATPPCMSAYLRARRISDHLIQFRKEFGIRAEKNRHV